MDLDSAADELYGLAPEEFTAHRTILERQARSGGDRDLAEQIRRLTRPTRSAWLVNLLCRCQPDTVEELLDLADLLAEGMRALSAPELTRLTRQRTEVVSAITRTALALGQDRGHRASDATRAEVVSTLTAALADPEVAEQVRVGRLTRPVTWSGFGLSGTPVASAPGRSTGHSEEPSGTGGTRTPDRVAEVVELAPHRREAERVRARARRSRAIEEERRARAGLARAIERVSEAEQHTVAARQRSAPAQRELQTAAAALAEAERAVERARREQQRIAAIAASADEALTSALERLRQLREDDARARTRHARARAELDAADEALSALGEPDP